MTVVSRAKFFSLFTLGEKAAFLTAVHAAKNSAALSQEQAAIIVVDEEFRMNDKIDVSNANVAAGLAMLANAGIITVARAQEIAAYDETPPDPSGLEVHHADGTVSIVP